MHLTFALSFLLLSIDSCIASAISSQSTRPGKRDDTSVCEKATAVTQNAACWARLGYNDWFETWKGPCPGPGTSAAPGCSCDQSRPWSDCVLDQYLCALDGGGGGGGGSDPAKLRSGNVSCMDLMRPEQCQIPLGDWTRLSENDLAAAYVSTAVGNLYDFVRGWYTAIMASPAPAAILETLVDQVASPSNVSVNRTDVYIGPYLGNFVTSRSNPNDNFLRSFVGVMEDVVGDEVTVDVGKGNIQTFQDALGQALNKTLIAILSKWDNPYFDTLAKNGALLNIGQLEKAPQLNHSLTHASPEESFDITRAQDNLAFGNNTGRALLTNDMIIHRGYPIIECGSTETGGLAEHIIALIDIMHNNLFLVMRETTKGKRSQYGFSDLWKTDEWIPVRDLYEKMYNNEPIEGAFQQYNAVASNRPVFICIQPHNSATWAPYNVCRQELRLRAFQQPESPNLIGICPSFWALPASPPRAFCPYKGRITAEYVGTALQLNQQSILIHQLVKIYLNRTILSPESFTLADTLKLTPEEASRNPSTWAYWYSSVIGCAPMSWGDPEL